MEKKLLCGVSVVDCWTDEQWETHDKMYVSALDSIDFSCGFTACYSPVNHPRKSSRYDFRMIDRFDDLMWTLDGTDFKNGADVYAIPNGFLFRVYGQTFSRDNGKTWETITEDVILTRTEYRYY